LGPRAVYMLRALRHLNPALHCSGNLQTIGSHSGVRGPPGDEKIGVLGQSTDNKTQEIQSDKQFENMSALKQ